jgi:hypothetical protein
MYRLASACLLFFVTALALDSNDDLLNAARKGDLGAVKALIEKGVPV